MAVETPAAVSDVVEWRLRNARTREERTFEQSELPIEGEARLLGMAGKLKTVLATHGTSVNDIGNVVEHGTADWEYIAELLAIIADEAPDMVADAATVLLNIYPTDENGNRNPTFDDDRRYLRNAIGIGRLTQMVEVFLRQNNWDRLAAPFYRQLTGLTAQGSGSDSGAPLTPGSVIGLDGQPIQLEPEAEPTSTPTTTTAPLDSATETPSESSRPSSLPESRQRRRRSSGG